MTLSREPASRRTPCHAPGHRGGRRCVPDRVHSAA